MKVHLIIASSLLCAARVLAAQGPTPAADEVVTQMYAHDTVREAGSGGYTGNREYVLENHRLQKRASMLVRVTCDQSGTKQFEWLDRAYAQRDSGLVETKVDQTAVTLGIS